jgi:hypothetical protein
LLRKVSFFCVEAQTRASRLQILSRNSVLFFLKQLSRMIPRQTVQQVRAARSLACSAGVRAHASAGADAAATARRTLFKKQGDVKKTKLHCPPLSAASFTSAPSVAAAAAAAAATMHQVTSRSSSSQLLHSAGTAAEQPEA